MLMLNAPADGEPIYPPAARIQPAAPKTMAWHEIFRHIFSFPGAAATDDIGDSSLKHGGFTDGQIMLADRGDDKTDDIHCHIVIDLPNAHANALYKRLADEFNPSTQEKSWSLAWLLKYDQFLAKKGKVYF